MTRNYFAKATQKEFLPPLSVECLKTIYKGSEPDVVRTGLCRRRTNR
jgi:hypothetical protein